MVMVLKLGNRMRVIPLNEADRAPQVSLWGLAEGRGFILTTPSGDNEIDGGVTFATKQAALDYAEAHGFDVVPLEVL
jgi:hypothetical protein